MFGFVVGALGLIALLKVARGYRHGYRCAGGDFGGHHGFGRHGGWGGRHGGSWRGRGASNERGGWRRFALYTLFERLDATPGQEKAITSAMDDLRAKLRKARETWSQSRGGIAEAIRGETLTEEQTAELTAPFASHFDEMRTTAGEAMRKIHDALDGKQRRILADIVESGWGRF
jgi:hypothetical protein